jgi:hypothetical protein
VEVRLIVRAVQGGMFVLCFDEYEWKKTVQNQQNGSRADCQGCPGDMLVLYINECEKNEKVEVRLIIRAVQEICLCCILINVSE